MRVRTHLGLEVEKSRKKSNDSMCVFDCITCTSVQSIRVAHLFADDGQVV